MSNPYGSSSRNSSSSVRNPYGLSSNKLAKNTSSAFEYDYAGVKCKCDLPAPCQETWKRSTLDSDRRFFGCSRYLVCYSYTFLKIKKILHNFIDYQLCGYDPKRRCNFFLWADPSYPERARDVIKELRMKLKKKDEEFQNFKSGMNFLKRKMFVLNEEISLLQKKNGEAAADWKKRESGSSSVNKMVVFLVVVCVILFLFK